MHHDSRGPLLQFRWGRCRPKAGGRGAVRRAWAGRLAQTVAASWRRRLPAFHTPSVDFVDTFAARAEKDARPDRGDLARAPRRRDRRLRIASRGPRLRRSGPSPRHGGVGGVRRGGRAVEGAGRRARVRDLGLRTTTSSDRRRRAGRPTDRSPASRASRPSTRRPRKPGASRATAASRRKCGATGRRSAISPSNGLASKAGLARAFERGVAIDLPADSIQVKADWVKIGISPAG